MDYRTGENLKIADDVIDQMLARIQPTTIAENKRRDVINYIQSLMKTSLAFEVFPYGSVPLKTYLLDGDIDLTALCSPSIEATLFADVHAALEREERNKAAPFQVKGINCINAEVKLVKCIIDDIVVDISFNQLGGLRTLCFLEQVDRLIGKDHLYKRCVILIKAWCCYESRILGAHHGLISTYALETLVLYILLVDDSLTSSPLSILCRFLDYFSKFDWDKYCFTLNGPVFKSSLPDIVAAFPENRNDKPFQTREFLKRCVDIFSIPSHETTSRVFALKFLNIIDPLNTYNNLGRSVSKGNCLRICSAFKYGADKLSQILLLPSNQITARLNHFFANTLVRYTSCSPCSSPDPVDGDENPLLDLSGDFGSHYWSVVYGQYCQLSALPPPSLDFGECVRYSLESKPNEHFRTVRSIYPIDPAALCSSSSEPNLQGTGTYFPNTNLCSNGFPGPVAHDKVEKETRNRSLAEKTNSRSCEQPIGQSSNAKSPIRNDGIRSSYIMRAADFPPLSVPRIAEESG